MEFIYTLDSWGLLLLQVCRAREKLLFLVALLQQFRDQRTIVFTASVEATHRLFLLLRCFYNDEAHVVAEYSSKGSESVRRLVRKSSCVMSVLFQINTNHYPQETIH